MHKGGVCTKCGVCTKMDCAQRWQYSNIVQYRERAQCDSINKVIKLFYGGIKIRLMKWLVVWLHDLHDFVVL